MTSTDNNEETISTRKNKKPTTFAGQVGNFATSLFIIICVLVIYYIFGGLVLWCCKLAQSNILPTDIESFPYTESQPNIQPISTNIFTTYSDPPTSMKLNIPYDKNNSKNIIIDILRNYKNEPFSSSTGNFFVSIIEGLLSFNYSSLNLFFNLLNYLPEPLILVIGPIVTTIFTTIIFLLDHFYLLYLWFVNMGWFFKQNENTEANHKPVWREVTLLDPVNYGGSIVMIILFLCLFWGLLATLPFLPLFTVCWTLLSTLLYKGSLNQKPIGPGGVVKDVFKYYKVLIMSVFSFFIVTSAFANLGSMPGLFCLLTLFLIIFGVITIDTFHSTPETNLTALVSNDQAKKTRSSNNSDKSKHGLLYELLFHQNGGKQMIKEIKHAGNILRGGGKK